MSGIAKLGLGTNQNSIGIYKVGDANVGNVNVGDTIISVEDGISGCSYIGVIHMFI